MSEWYDSQNKPSGNLHKLLQERIDKASPRRKELTTDEAPKPLKNLTVNYFLIINNWIRFAKSINNKSFQNLLIQINNE
jgi:hypothetical protein